MLALARKAGADGAEVLVRDGTELEVKVRLGETELIKEAGSRALGLRVIKDQRSAVTYTSDLSPAGLERLARESVELAGLSEPDPEAALPAREEMARELADLDLWDEATLAMDVAEGIRRARLGEAAAMKLDKRITNSDGAVFGRTIGASAFATSAGFSGSVRGTLRDLLGRAARRRRRWQEAQRIVLERQPLCGGARGSGGRRARGGAAHGGQAGGAQVADRRRAGRILARGWPRSPRSIRRRHVGRRRLAEEHLSRDAGGDRRRVASGRDRRRPLLRRGPGSRPFDAEGLQSRTNVLVSEGILRGFLCDVYAARKLGRRSTGSASRVIGGGPHVGVTNLIFRPGRTPPPRSNDSSGASTSPI